ncbi:hypothetical protein PMIN01_08169 [Paraphaeosphaeria minitans]|uniref:Uncharacterized protein n=1 Tax=Paraphaeosphaeria minitans TaxID=565426 RepID=A0A9P6KPJ3_9PLEO|nr:hypothetical protein PMIN01_08169 [Paraphaeosphaeria minitans]
MWVICCLSHEAPTPSEKEPLLRSYVSQQYFSRSQPTIAKPQDSVELPPSSQRCELRLPPPPPPPSPSPPPQALPAGPIPAHLVFFTDKPTLKDDIVINVLEYGIAIKGDRVVLGAGYMSILCQVNVPAELDLQWATAAFDRRKGDNLRQDLLSLTETLLNKLIKESSGLGRGMV